MVKWAKEEKVDFIIGETFYYAEEAFAALEEIKNWPISNYNFSYG